MEPIFTSEVTLLTDALCKGVTNLSSITRKRDPLAFRTQLKTIISLLKREFDRVNFPTTYFTVTEDINATLRMVEKQLWDLTHKVRMKDVEQTKNDIQELARIEHLLGQSSCQQENLRRTNTM